VPLKIGVIGCGRAAERGHLPALGRLREVEVVALADTDRAWLDRLGDRFGVAARYADHDELLADPGVEAVAICVPAAHHVEVALASLDAGKHFLVEKPLALSLTECDRLIEHASRSAARGMIGFNMRWHRLVRRMRRAVDAGTLGRLRLLRTVYASGSRLEPDLPDWRGRRELGGGALIEQGVHHFDLWRFLLGSEVDEVFAVAQGADETATVTARMRNGVLVESAFCQFTRNSNDLELYGEHGRLRVCCYRFDGFELLENARSPGGGPARLARLARIAKEAPHVLRSGGTFRDSYRAQWRHFIAAIERGSPFEATLEDGRRAVEVALAAAESTSTGAPVTRPTGRRSS
jgi:myo-inositol 2-dehydrogenase/D-chiro-inositol 1-dehydrogenase